MRGVWELRELHGHARQLQRATHVSAQDVPWMRSVDAPLLQWRLSDLAVPASVDRQRSRLFAKDSSHCRGKSLASLNVMRKLITLFILSSPVACAARLEVHREHPRQREIVVERDHPREHVVEREPVRQEHEIIVH